MSRIPIRSTELVMADRGEVKFAKGFTSTIEGADERHGRLAWKSRSREGVEVLDSEGIGS